MVSINLLPWRDYLTAYQRRRLQQIGWGGLLSNLFVIILLHTFLQQTIEHTQADVTLLRQQMREIIHQQIVQAAISVSHQQKTLPQEVLHKLFIPYAENVCFTSIAQHENSIRLIGVAASAVELTTFLTHWPTAKLFTEMHVQQLQHGAHQIQFTIEGNNAALVF